jgi:hypothetical protein
MPQAKVTELFPEADPMEAARQFDKLDGKLDDLIKSMGTVVADIARGQGTQTGILASIDILSKAIGDVMQTKIEAAATTVKVDALTERIATAERAINRRIDDVEKDQNQRDTRSWVEQLIKGTLIAAGFGGSAGGVYALIQRLGQ